MIVKGIISEDFINYKRVSMTIMFPYCKGFKCGSNYCQNSSLANEKNIEINVADLVSKYVSNPITDAVVLQGLEPFDSWDDVLTFIKELRKNTIDEVVIYTGYDKNEILEQVKELSKYPNIIIKFGRYVPNETAHYDSILGVKLASNNQYAEKIS